MADPVPGGHGGSNGHSNGHATNGHATNGHAGHGGVRFERSDVKPGGLYIFALVLSMIVLGAVSGVSLIYDYLRKEAERQNRNIATLVVDAAKKPGEQLPNDNGKTGPILEGIEGTNPSAPRSGVMGYPTLSGELIQSSDKRLTSYGYLDKEKSLAHIPIEVAIEQLAGKLPVRAKAPKGVEIGSIVNPWSFFRSGSSSGRKGLGVGGEDRKLEVPK